jgi:hypothetical protein
MPRKLQTCACVSVRACVCGGGWGSRACSRNYWHVGKTLSVGGPVQWNKSKRREPASVHICVFFSLRRWVQTSDFPGGFQALDWGCVVALLVLYLLAFLDWAAVGYGRCRTTIFWSPPYFNCIFTILFLFILGISYLTRTCRMWSDHYPVWLEAAMASSDPCGVPLVRWMSPGSAGWPSSHPGWKNRRR